MSPPQRPPALAEGLRCPQRGGPGLPQHGEGSQRSGAMLSWGGCKPTDISGSFPLKQKVRQKVSPIKELKIQNIISLQASEEVTENKAKGAGEACCRLSGL